MLIGEAARSAGLRASAIRYYEAQGIVPRPTRTPEGYRYYTDNDVDLLRFVRQLRSLELSLGDIREIVSVRSSGVAPCDLLRQAIVREISAMDRRIEELRRARENLVVLRTEAEGVEDDWPLHCVCHLVDPPSPGPPRESAVDVTLQYFDGCPNWETTGRHLDQLGVRVRYQRIETPEAALEHGFRGSPTVLVDGVDPFFDPAAPVGLACRVYRGPAGPAGSPTFDQLKEVIDAARKGG